MSAFVPGYQHDIFVSYAHVDDMTFPGIDAAGWVATLIAGLNVLLSKRLGRSVLFSLWKDEQLSPNKPLTPEILNALKQSATLVIILSPGYMASPWCQREMQTFWQELAQRSRSDSRIFVVERDKLEIDEKPKALEELLGYQFWLRDREGKSPRLLGDPIPDPHDRFYRFYYDKLTDLATDLANELRRLKKNQETQPKAAITEPDSRPTVFLAEVTDDLEAQRDKVQRHLDQEGFRVIPSETSNYFSYLGGHDNVRETIANDLKNCKLFVQLLSGLTGKCRPGLPSFPALQYETALSAGIPVLQWRAPDLKLETIKQTEHHSLLAGDTILVTGLEEFKQELVTRLHILDKKNKLIINSLDIFLSYAHEDFAKAKQLAVVLEEKGWSVFWDTTSILAGDDFDDVIEKAIDSAKCMIVIWSKASKKSHYVRDEARKGRERNILVPILVEPIDPPMGFGSIHTENFAAWNGDLNSDEFNKLQRAVTRLAK